MGTLDTYMAQYYILVTYIRYTQPLQMYVHKVMHRRVPLTWLVTAWEPGHLTYPFLRVVPRPERG